MVLKLNIREIIVILLFLLILGAGIHPQPEELGGLTVGAYIEASPLMKALRITSYPIILFLIWEQWKRFIYVATREIPLLLLIGVALVSIIWSDSPLVTIENSKGLLRTTLFAIYIATRYSIKEHLRLFALVAGLTALLTIIVCLAFPAYGIMNPVGEQTMGWRGIFFHKNDLGGVMAAGASTFLLISLNSHRHRWLMWIGFGLCTAVLFLANGKGAIVLFITLLLLLPLHKILRQHYSLQVPILLAVIILVGGSAVWITNNMETILIGMGKDPSFNGRTGIWEIIIVMILRRPLLGYGYFGFWDSHAAEVVDLYTLNSSWSPGHAHNGLLTLMLDVGVLGLTLFMLSFLIAFKRAIIWTRCSRTIEGLWPLQVLTMVVMLNVSDNMILMPSGSLWILYVMTAFSLAVERSRVLKIHPAHNPAQITINPS